VPPTIVDKLHVRGRLGEREKISLLSSPTSSARATSQLTEPRASDLLIAAFGVQPDGIYVERNGIVTRGARPDWLDWPMVRGDEFAPQSPATPKAKR
jgi:hypothetical protein